MPLTDTAIRKAKPDAKALPPLRKDLIQPRSIRQYTMPARVDIADYAERQTLHNHRSMYQASERLSACYRFFMLRTMSSLRRSLRFISPQTATATVWPQSPNELLSVLLEKP
jgi:hypothetical protein